MVHYAAFHFGVAMPMFARSRIALAGLVAAAGFAVAAASLSLTAMAADPAKVLRIAFPTAETGFDPARVSDIYSTTVNEAIFERLLTYDYLARPAKLVPMVAEAMPEVTENGKVYTFRIRKGIHFTPDPAFKGVKRELVAQDFIYSFMRFMDPKLRSPYAFLVEGKIEGLDALAAKAKETGKFDYDAKIPGMVAVDRYTLRFRLVQNDYNFPFITAMVPSWVVAREVIEAYGEDTLAHPVGTGPYMLKSWTRGAKIVLEANPDYRGFVWDFVPAADPWDQKLVAAMKGKRMPQIGRVEISIIEENQSRWLAFSQKEIDYLNLPAAFRSEVFEGNSELKPAWMEKGVTVFRAIDPSISYSYINFRDPLVGGFSREKIALRRAIIMAYNLDEEIRVIRKHQAVAVEMPIPVGVIGHDPTYRGINRYDPALANKLLDHFKYARGKDGYRSLPDGKPLVLRFASGTSAQDREFNELWKKSMEAIGLRIEFQVLKFADQVKASKACQVMLAGSGWTADYPDGDNFMQLLYGPNTGQSNNGCYESKAFDAFYVKSTRMPDSPERNRLFLEMTRQMEVDGAWGLRVSPERNQLLWPWVQGYKKHPILLADFVYMDVAPRR
jgi:ABC-type transport system substrate-binding protein